MSKKQEKHLQKAREIKARKNKKGLDSNDLMGKIDEFISHINVEEQAKGTNASNILNTLINAQKLKKENEILNGENKANVEPLVLKFIDSDTPENRLQMALIDKEIREDRGEITHEKDYIITDALQDIRELYNLYGKILENYDDHNNLITDIKKVIAVIGSRKLTKDA